jgi:MFS family permease
MTTQKRALAAIFIISSVFLLQSLTGTTIAYIIDSYSSLPPATVQQLMSLPALFGLVVTIIIGPIAMRINKKYLTIIAALLSLIYFAIFAFVGSNGPFPLLLCAAGFVGIAQGMSMTLISAMIGEFVGPEKSATYVAISTALMNGGSALMAIIGGSIAAGNGGANWPRAYIPGIVLVPAIIAFGILMPKKPDGAAQAAPHKAPPGEAPSQPAEKYKLPSRLFAIGILGLFTMVFACGFLFYISVYIVNEFKLGSSVEVGIANSIFTIAGLVTGFTYALWAKLFKKALIVVAFGLITLGLFCMMTFTTTLFGAFAAALIIGWGFNMMNPFSMGFIMQIIPPRLAPVGISFLMAGVNVGMFVAIFVLNFLSGLLGGGLKNVLLICTVGMAACGVAGFFVYRTKVSSAQAAEAKVA